MVSVAACFPQYDPWVIDLPPTIVAIVQVVILMFSFNKLIEIWIHAAWVVRKGSAYREAVLSLLRNAGNDKVLEMSSFRKIDDDLGAPWGHFWLQLRRVFRRNTAFLNGVSSVGVLVDRQPTLLFGLSLMLMLSPHPSLIWWNITLVLALIFSSLFTLVFSRAILGVADNFRPDLSVNPVRYYNREHVRLSRAEFVGKFLLGIILSLGVAVFAFAAVYYGLYEACGHSSFSGLLPDVPAQLQFFYFSLVTLATVGFGDIYPSSAFTQIVVIFEVVFSLGILVVLIFALSNTFSLEDV